MKNVPAHILLCCLVLAATAEVSAKRKPLVRPVLKNIEHEPTGTRLRPDPKTGQPSEYELDGKITYDKKSGNFLLTWNGVDGQRKTIVYEPATKLDAVIAATVDYDARQNVYRYTYAVTNLPTSKQTLQTFYLEARAPIHDVSAPDATWYSVALTDYLREQFKVRGGWTWSQTMHGRVGLLPAQEASGFTYLSAGLPTVVKCYVRHRGFLKGVGEELPEELHAAIDRVGWKIPQGVTVGPVAVPQPFHPATFARKILEMLEVSVQQGWVESSAVAAELRVSLNNLAVSLDQGDTNRASKQIRRLLERVEGEKNKSLLSEAYALLRFNLQFLQKQIAPN